MIGAGVLGVGDVSGKRSSYLKILIKGMMLVDGRRVVGFMRSSGFCQQFDLTGIPVARRFGCLRPRYPQCGRQMMRLWMTLGIGERTSGALCRWPIMPVAVFALFP
jgi:hypothetical protein